MHARDMISEIVVRRKHKNARLSFAARLELARHVIDGKAALRAAAAQHGITVTTARKWIRRYMEHGAAGLHDDSSRPHRSPKATAPDKVAAITDLRRNGMSMMQIAQQVGCSVSTVSRICGQTGLSLRHNEITEPHGARDGATGSPDDCYIAETTAPDPGNLTPTA